MTDSSEVRVRFAPSPTGFFHIGSARTALFNWLYARHTNGKFVLRVEDTDSARNTPEALAALLDGMRWLGLDWDEGPEVGGDYGPYFQSERQNIYTEYLQKLLDAGRAYEKDDAIFFKLEGERYVEFDKYKNAEVEKVRTEPITVKDAIRGDVTRNVETDFVIRRSNGDYGFHFVNVVDDIAMNITHVIRGEDHLSNTARHVEIYQALGAQPPVFAHLPLILKTDGKGKMSKRDQGSLIEEYVQRKFIPEAVRNFICLLGWNPKDGNEIMAIGDIIEKFDFPGIQKEAARFDEKKMAFINTEYLRKLPVETFCWMAGPVLAEAKVIDESTDEDYLHAILAISQEKARDFEGLPALVGPLFNEEFAVDPEAQKRVFKKGEPMARLAELLPVLEQVDPWCEQTIDQAIIDLAEKKDHRKFDYFPIARLAVSGQAGGPDLLALLRALGKERVIARMRRFAEMQEA